MAKPGTRPDAGSEVQPVDGYVRQVLANASRRYGLPVDLENPTRAQRLEIAVAMSKESGGFTSFEIMAGRRVKVDEPIAANFMQVLLLQTMGGMTDKRAFYDGFNHEYSGVA